MTRRMPAAYTTTVTPPHPYNLRLTSALIGPRTHIDVGRGTNELLVDTASSALLYSPLARAAAASATSGVFGVIDHENLRLTLPTLSLTLPTEALIFCLQPTSSCSITASATSTLAWATSDVGRGENSEDSR